jgi:redox-sensitive bicupin YhaK (pirin superfamily)
LLCRASRSIFFYVVRGSLRVSGTEAKVRELVEFSHDGDDLTIEALADSVLLLGHAEPFGEPVVSGGPFVMNTEAEIEQAYTDYQQGKFGRWNG